MVDKIDKLAVNAVLFSIADSIHKLIGKSSEAIIRNAGPKMIEEMEKKGIKVETNNLAEMTSQLTTLFKELGLCNEIEFATDEEQQILQIRIFDCSFWETTMAMKEKGVWPPISCPFASMTMALCERNLGRKALVNRIEPIGDRSSLVELMLR